MGNEKTAETIDATKPEATPEVVAEVEKGAELGKEEAVEQPEAKPEEKPKQSAEENAEQARRRREEERQKALEQRELETVIRITGGVNPYTQEKIEDKTDLDEFYLMKEIEKAGGDPIADYAKYQKQKRKEEREKGQQKRMTEDQARKDWQSFQTAHPDISLDTLMADQRFLIFADGKIGNQPLTKIYDDYTTFIQPVKAEPEKKVEPKVVKPSPGSLHQPETADETIISKERLKSFTPAQLRAMSPSEFKKVADSQEYWLKHK